MDGIRNKKQEKILYGKIFLFLILILSLTSHNAFSFEGPGLYKDGQKIMGFDIVSPQDIAKQSDIHEDEGSEPSRLKKLVSDHMREAIKSPEKFKEQNEFIKIVLECKKLCEKIKQKLEQGEKADYELGLLLQKKEGLVNSNGKLLSKFDQIEQKCKGKGYSDKFLERHTNMVKNHQKSLSLLLSLLEGIKVAGRDESPFEKIEELNKYFIENKIIEDPPLVNKQNLPVNIEKQKAPSFKKDTPLSERIKSAGPSVLSLTPPTQADLDPTIDVQFTEDIIELANSLNNSPLKIYEYVRNNFEFEPYLGSRKGSQVTLTHRSGNDYDLASLLIALLRVSDIPARYATGLVEMPVDKAKNWLGVEDGAIAGSILTTAGMEGVNIIDGSEVIAIQCRRVWVEAYIPYTNYRGIPKDDTGKMWIPLDCTFKQYDYNAGMDVPKEMAFDAESFVDDYISTFHENSPVEVYKQQLIDYIAVNYPDLTYEDVVRTRGIHSEDLGLIPGSLPHKLLTRDGEYAEIPENKRYKVRFHIYGEGSTLDYTANLPEIAGKQVTISYIGATAEDQQIIDDSGGLFRIESPWLVHLKPVLKVDGCDVAVGSGEVTMGISQNSDMDFIQPVGANNEVPAIYNTIISGTYQGVGIDTWKLVTNLFAPPTTACEESYTGYLLHDTALKYLGRVDAADEEVNKTMQIVALNDVSEAIVEHVVKVTYSGGNPITFEWSGLRVDADRKISGPFSINGDDEGCNYMRLTGADGSISENRLFEDNFNEEAVSTIKILELASDMGIPIYEIDSTNIGTILPLLTVSSSIKSTISSSVAGGNVVTIARDEITYYDWTGTGYIDLDPVTCAAGYIISGGRSGGETVKEWNFNPSAYCINATINSISPAAINDIYCAEDTSYLVFDVTIDPYDSPPDCTPLQDYNKSFSTGDQPNSLTIKDIADKYGGGVYTFKVGSTGGCAGCGIASKNFTIIKVTLKTLEFTSDHNLLNNGTSLLSAGTRFSDIEWSPDSTPPINAPITHTAEENLSISIKLTLDAVGMPSNSPYTITGSSSEGALEFSKTGQISAGSVEIPITASNYIGKEIRKISESITWSISITGSSPCDLDLGTTGPHIIYTTLGAPIVTAPNSSSKPNVPRMERASAKISAAIAAAGSTADAYTCIPRIVWNVMKSAGDYNLDNSLTDAEAWTLPDVPGGADCRSIARFVRNVLMVMGGPGSFVSKTYMAYYRTSAEPNRPNKAIEGSLNSPNIRPGDQGTPLTSGLDPGWVIFLADRNCKKYGDPDYPAGTVGCGPKGINAYEAALIYTDTANKKWYFPAGVKDDPRYDNKNYVVQIFQTLVWVDFGDHDGDPGTADVLIVKAVDFTYTRPLDVELCP